MKKILIVLGSLVVLVLLAAVLIPVLFKDDIQKAMDEEVDKYVDAQIYYDTEAFSLSLFTHFPDITVSIGDFGIVGNAPFAGDTLVSVKEFQLTVDIMSAINGDQIEVVDVLLDKPQIKILVLEDGTANYDIAKDTGETAEASSGDASSDPMSIAINHWEIIDGDVVYLDQSLAFYTTLFDIDHSGNGDFAQDVFDMVSETSIGQFSLGYEGDEYITNKKLTADVILGMDLANMKFTFKENTVSLNQFGFGFDGFVSMPAEDINMDISFAGKDISIASVLSLIPGLYQDYLEGLQASGEVGFDGYVKGTYNDESMPAIMANLNVGGGRIQYSEYPVPMEQIEMKSTFNYPSADLTETSFLVDNFSMMIDGEKLTASLLFEDLEDYFWDLQVNGAVDLEKVLKIVPIENTDLSGKIQASLTTSGRMSDLEAEAYEKLETSGTISVDQLKYISTDLPQGFGIASAEASFDPEKIALSTFAGNAGKTDLNMSGQITNYLQYALEEDAVLIGDFIFTSSLVDINEFMTEDESEEESSETDTATMEVVRIPTDIKFTLNSSIDKLLYDNLELKSFKGQVVVEGGSLYLNGVRFDLLDGSFEMNGLYATAEEEPTFDFDFAIEKLSIPAAFKSFTTIQKLVPFAEKMNGKFSTDFKLGGALGMDMMPKMESLTGAGLVEIAQASIEEVKLVSAVSSVSKLDNPTNNVSLKDVMMSAEVKDGRVYIEPFDLTIAGYTATIAGSNTVDGQLDYSMTMKNVSTGAVGDAVSGMVSSLAGGNQLDISKVDLNFGIGGDFSDPKVKLNKAAPAGSASTSVTAAVKDQAKERLSEEKKKVVAEIDAKKEEAVDSAKVVIDATKAEAKEEAKEEVEKAKEEAKDAVKNLFGKKKKKGGGK